MQSVPQNNNEQISCIAQVKCFLSSIAKKKEKKKREIYKIGDHTHACIMNLLDPISLFYRGVEFFKFSQKDGGGGGGGVQNFPIEREGW